MSRDASITFLWADGEYTFRLPIGQIRELQEKTDCGPPYLFARIEAGLWKVDDLLETIRLGLIGGGMAPPEARKLVVRYVEGRPWSESVDPAKKILAVAVDGPEDEPIKKKQPARKRKSRSRTESSASPPSSQTAP